MSYALTDHAARRCRQRAVPPEVVELLLDYGDRAPAGGGCRSYAFSRRSVERALRTEGARAARLVAEYRHTYLIQAADGAIVTVAYR